LDQRNLIVAVIVSAIILIGYQVFYEMPRMRAHQAQQQALVVEQQAQQGTAAGTAADAAAEPPVMAPGSENAAPTVASATDKPREQVLAATPRVAIDTPQIKGSIALKGARIDDVVLPAYRETLEPDSPPIVLFSPPGAAGAYFGEFGWIAEGGAALALPTSETVWTADQPRLTPDQPVTLSWDNGQGLRFSQTIAVDRNFLFTVTQRVENRGTAPVTLYPYGLVRRHGMPQTLGFFILHEGMLGVFDGTLKEVDYSDLQDDGAMQIPSTGGWAGITDKYWLAAVIPDQQSRVTAHFVHNAKDGGETFQADVLRDPVTVEAGGTAAVSSMLFAGAKVVSVIDGYADDLGVQRFDLAVDWGWFPFLTKPIFKLMEFFYHLVGNFGIAILLLTVVIRLLFFPLAQKSYKAMTLMKALQPEMMKLRERFKDDRAKLQQEMMALYKKQKVNPAAGCLPILIQIPVFFALYKVLFVTIEMRHAPFYGWIKDLSAPDPTTIFNLFGLIPWDPPQFLMIGIWPLIMGITMYLQQKINPAPPDPLQAKILMLLPVVFTFMLASFPAGLVIYWSWSNTLSIAQQWLIMKRMGVKA